MSRSVHTRPRAIRAESRVRARYTPRAAADTRHCDVRVRVLKETGVVAAAPEPRPNERSPILPRIHQTRPRPGFVHPITRADILALLTFFGPSCWYGLRTIALARGNATTMRHLRFGSLLVPGRIILYDQPAPPWIISGKLSDAARDRCTGAGASITEIGNGTQTVIDWPGETLR